MVHIDIVFVIVVHEEKSVENHCFVQFSYVAVLYCLVRYNSIKIPNIKGHKLSDSAVLPTVGHDDCPMLPPFHFTFLALFNIQSIQLVNCH